MHYGLRQICLGKFAIRFPQKIPIAQLKYVEKNVKWMLLTVVLGTIVHSHEEKKRILQLHWR